MIPYVIQSNPDLYDLHLNIVNLRGEVHSVLAQIQTGAYSIKKDLLITVEKLVLNLKKIRTSIEVIIFGSDYPLFIAGSISITDYFSDYDLLEYYNDTIKIQLHLSGIIVNIKQLLSYKTRKLSISTQRGFENSIDDDEFLRQGGYSPITEVKVDYIYHRIARGDTYRSIAEQYTGDPNNASQLLDENSISTSDMIQGRVGSLIKIPVQAAVISGTARVYTVRPDIITDKSLAKFLYGTDIKLNNKRIVLSGNDFALLSGASVVMQNLNAKLKAKKKGLNPSKKWWGLGNLDNNLPYLISLDRYLKRAEVQALYDPRIIDATIEYSKLKVDGDKIRFHLKLVLAGGNILSSSGVVNG